MKDQEFSFKEPQELVTYAKALASEHRIRILEILDFGNFTINEIAEKLQLPVSSTSMHIKMLEDAHLILTRLESATRGTKKVCFKNIDTVTFNLHHTKKNLVADSFYINMPIGNFTNCEINGTCGLVSEYSTIGNFDNSTVFYYPNKTDAQLIWFETGFLEYRFPIDAEMFGTIESLEFSFECCSEAPSYNNNWPSDIFIDINDQLHTTFTSPGDFGGRRGKNNPHWWPEFSTQYGLLYHLRITSEGTFFQEQKISDLTLVDYQLLEQPFLKFIIGVDPQSEYPHGINLFGEKFGDYTQNILLRIDYRK